MWTLVALFASSANAGEPQALLQVVRGDTIVLADGRPRCKKKVVKMCSRTGQDCVDGECVGTATPVKCKRKATKKCSKTGQECEDGQCVGPAQPRKCKKKEAKKCAKKGQECVGGECVVEPAPEPEAPSPPPAPPCWDDNRSPLYNPGGLYHTDCARFKANDAGCKYVYLYEDDDFTPYTDCCACQQWCADNTCNQKNAPPAPTPAPPAPTPAPVEVESFTVTGYSGPDSFFTVETTLANSLDNAIAACESARSGAKPFGQYTTPQWSNTCGGRVYSMISEPPQGLTQYLPVGAVMVGNYGSDDANCGLSGKTFISAGHTCSVGWCAPTWCSTTPCKIACAM